MPNVEGLGQKVWKKAVIGVCYREIADICLTQPQCSARHGQWWLMG